MDEEPFQVALPANHPLTERAQIRESDLRDYKILLLEEGHCLRHQALTICKSPRVIEEFAVTCLGILRQMVAVGIDLTLLPELAIRPSQPTTYQHLIEIRPFAPPTPTRGIGLAWRRNFPRRAAIERLAEAIQNHLPPGLTRPVPA